MTTNMYKPKSKSKYTDLMIFLQKKIEYECECLLHDLPECTWGRHTRSLVISHTLSYPSETLHIHCCHLVDTIGITTRVMARTMIFLLHFKEGGRKRPVGFLFVFSSTRSMVLYSPTFNSHFHKHQSVSFQMLP